MIYVAYFIFGFTVLQFLVALCNLLLYQQLHFSGLPIHDKISILIPARNEEYNISQILNDVVKLEGLDLEIIVFNDQSTDRTSEIVSDFARRDSRIRLLNSDGLPTGWLGKNFACHSLAQKATGKYFLFLDADVRLNKSIIHKTCQYSQKHQLGLVSIFPKQIMNTFGERITVPNMNFILLSQLPLILVRLSSFPSLAAANGQFMFFDAKTYKETLPHFEKRNSKVEDIEIIRFYKSIHIQVACLLGDDTICCRMYQSFGEAVDGFAKNIIMFFGNSFLLAILFQLITSLGFVLVYMYSSLNAFLMYILLVLATRVFISMVSKQNSILNLILLVFQQFSMAAFIFQALKNSIQKKQIWKGRNI